MKRITIKEGFRTEPDFTKFIANDNETSQRLLAALDLTLDDGYAITPEEHTVHDKRVDLVVRDSEGEVVLVIESQDASGWLDSIHASKIAYYMYDKNCEDGVLLCEDADEHIKGFVKWYNENTPFRITLISVLVYSVGGKVYCDFIPLIRPSDDSDKKVKRTVENSEAQQARRERMQAMFDAYPGMFTNVAVRYVSRNNVANLGINVGIVPTSTGFRNTVWHNGKYNSPEFRAFLERVCKDNGWEAKFDARQGYFKTQTEADTINATKVMIAELEKKDINLG
jgi:hypothetical protein